MNWHVKKFDELSTREIFDILAARAEVFIVEQNCPYQDPDWKDPLSLHIWLENDGEIAAYCRITPPGTRYDEISIGRVISTEKYRGKKYGRQLMEYTINYIKENTDSKSIRISGQSYLRKFYESFGFVAVSDEYLEDNIKHIEFLLEF